MDKNFIKYPLIILFIIFSIFIHYKAKSPGLNEPEIAEQENQSNSLQSGQTAGNFSLEDLDGKKINLYDYKDIKPVILYFWRSDIPVCEESLDELQTFHIKYGDKIEILTINTGDLRLVLEKFLKEKNYDIKILIDTDSKITRKYGIYGPTLFLLDKDGTVLYLFSQTKESDGLDKILNGEILDIMEPKWN